MPNSDLLLRRKPPPRRSVDLSDRLLSTVFVVIFLPSHRSLFSDYDELDHTLIQSPFSVQLSLAPNRCIFRIAQSFSIFRFAAIKKG